ncbi:Thioredoxin-like protein AAED1 [Nymphaea thermarum]|nr:Thioredoxin-like protein AAED1 [Nymphaea thermarum]
MAAGAGVPGCPTALYAGGSLQYSRTCLSVTKSSNGIPRKVPLYENWQNGRVSFRRRRVRAPVVSSSSENAPLAVMPEDAEALLDDVKVLDLSGKEIPVTDLWKERKAVVAFARHFGCVLCRKRADLLASVKDKLDDCEAALVLIGPGNLEQAKAFSEQTKFKGEVYADPSHSSYNALKFVSGVTTTFTPAAGMKIIQLYLEGYRQDWKLSFEKDTVSRGGWQQGGILVAGPGKTNILYLHKDKEAGDDPDVEQVLKACCL